MYRLSLIISEIYNKYLPLAEKDGIILNLDFSDTTKEISDPDRVKQYLDEHLDSALKRSDKGEVTIGVDKSAITITDSGTTLSRSACALLSNRYIDVSSRVGFGTTIKIFLQPRELPEKPTNSAPLEVQGVGISAAVDNSTNNPTAESAVKITAKKGKEKLGLGARLRLKGKEKTSAKKATPLKSAPAKISAKNKKSATTAKPTKKSAKTKTNRQLAAAARKADREVKRIAKKASKQSRKLTKKPAAKKSSAQTAQKKTKKKLELS